MIFTAVAPLDEISVANSVQVEVSANKKNVENKISDYQSCKGSFSQMLKI